MLILATAMVQRSAFSLLPHGEVGQLPVNMAETGERTGNEALTSNPVVVVQEIGQLGRNFLREIGSVFWFIVNTFEETLERVRHGRVPFRATSFFRHAQRAGVD